LVNQKLKVVVVVVVVVAAAAVINALVIGVCMRSNSCVKWTVVV